MTHRETNCTGCIYLKQGQCQKYGWSLPECHGDGDKVWYLRPAQCKKKYLTVEEA